MIGAGHPGGGAAGDPQLPFCLRREAAGEQRGRQRGQQDHGAFPANRAAGDHHQQRGQRLHQACRRIEATVPGFQGFHIIGGGVRAGNAAPLPEPEKCPCRQSPQRRGNQPPPRRQRLRGVDQAPAVVTEKQRFQHHHGMAKQGHRQGGEQANQRGDQQATKHHLHVRIGMKTVHRSWRESENMALL